MHVLPYRIRHRLPCAVAIIMLLLTLPGCASRGALYRRVELEWGRHHYDAADKAVEKAANAYRARDVILYYFDRAMALHLAGNYMESNTFLFKAEERIDTLYTKSISTGIGAMVTNDMLLPYEGEDFEKVQINILAALNYAYMGDLDEALVEARKVDLKLTAYNDRYATKSVYKEDGFARYLSGLLYEARGELNDAFIAYRKALEAYETSQQHYGTALPPFLPADLLRVTEALGLREEYNAYRRRFPRVQYETMQTLQNKGELIFISYNGLAPLKESYAVHAPVPGSKQRSLHLVRVAFPRFVARGSAIDHARLSVAMGDERFATRSYTVQDITAIAQKDLQDRIGRITGKALLRAAAKYGFARGIEEGTRRSTKNDTAGAVAGILANIAAVATERADTRSWRTLPGAFQLGRLSLPPGTATVSAVYYATSGGILAKKSFPNIRVEAGKKTFIGYRLLK